MNSIEENSMLKDAIVTECANAMSELQRTWQLWETQDNEVPEFLKIAQCILQMICLKTNTIMKMTEGISLVKGTNRIVDFSSILPVIRSAYELCFVISLYRQKRKKSWIFYFLYGRLEDCLVVRIFVIFLSVYWKKDKKKKRKLTNLEMILLE